MKDRIHVHFESIPSTNDFAKESVLGGTWLNYPLLVSADEQTAGRGRYGKTFYSPKNTGVYMSYAYEKKYTEEELLAITTRVAKLLLPILQAHSDKDLRIKPVNDIYIGEPGLPDSRKIAGILTERVDYPDRPGDYFIVIGIGINCFASETKSDDQSDTQGGTHGAVPSELANVIGWLEPDCSISDLIEEIADALSEL